MFCTECGNKLDDGTRFCPFCGTPVFAAPAAEEAEEVIEEVKESPEEIIEEPAQEATEEPVREAVEEAAEPVIETVEEAAKEPAETVEEVAEEIQETVAEEAAKQAEETVDAVAEPEIKTPEPEVNTPEPEVIGSAAATAQKPASATPQNIAMVLAAVSVLCLFIGTSRGTIVNRIVMIIAAGILTFLTVRKEKYPSVLYSIPVCIAALLNLSRPAINLIRSIFNRYIRISISPLRSVYSILLIVFFVLLLLMGVNAVKNKKSANLVILICSALVAICNLLDILKVKFQRPFFFGCIAMILFCAAYIVICLNYAKTGQDDPEKAFEAEPVTGRAGERRNYSYAGTRAAAPSASTERGPLFGPSAAPSEPVKTTAKAAEPSKDTAPMFAENPEFIFCIRCGAKLPADSAFCNKCGAPVVK